MADITKFVSKYLGGVADAVTSVLDTIVFIEFIYEEALQTAVFAAKTAFDAKDYDTAQEIINFILTQIYPKAVTFLDTWGDIAPYSKDCFALFYEAARLNALALDNAIPRPSTEKGTLRIYSNKPDVEVYINGEKVGVTDETEGILLELVEGEYLIEGKKEGYETAVKTVYVKAKEYTAVKLYLTTAEE